MKFKDIIQYTNLNSVFEFKLGSKLKLEVRVSRLCFMLSQEVEVYSLSLILRFEVDI